MTPEILGVALTVAAFAFALLASGPDSPRARLRLRRAHRNGIPSSPQRHEAAQERAARLATRPTGGHVDLLGVPAVGDPEEEAA